MRTWRFDVHQEEGRVWVALVNELGNGDSLGLRPLEAAKLAAGIFLPAARLVLAELRAKLVGKFRGWL